MRHKCGTRGYIAPEVTFARDHVPIEVTSYIDIWAFGMVLCVFAVGYNPYEVYRQRLFKKGREPVDVIFSEVRDWDNVSSPLKDLISQCLKQNPKSRITARQALEHPWFRGPSPLF